MPVQLRKSDPYPILVDGEKVRLHFTRMSVVEFAVFSAKFGAFTEQRPTDADAKGDDAAEPGENTPKVEPPKVEPPKVEPPKVEPPKVDAEEEAEDRRKNAVWIRESFDKYVTVERGDYLAEDGTPITNGAHFLDNVLMGRWSLVVDALVELFMENKLTPAQKKTWQSQRGSETTSVAPPTADSGPVPAPAAPPVDANASVSGAAAMVHPEGRSSGTTDRSS